MQADMSSPRHASPSASRMRFIEFIQALYRFLGHVPPEPEADDDEELKVELQIDEVCFFVIHSPEHPSRLTACARVGTLPGENALRVCRQLLALNMQLAWNSHATLGVDEESGDIFYMFKTNLDFVEPRGFLDSLQRVAREVEAWINEHLSTHEDTAASSWLSMQHGLAPV